MGDQYKPVSAPTYREGPFSWPSWDTREAYAAALRALYKEYPTITPYERNQQMDREDAHGYAMRGNFVAAHNYARSGGIPEDRITVLEALLL